uniref:Uncharacterized protein n=1 Tax=Anguilla anguilla TaxID=7936 RepID=A0A0E9WM04_ANGAN
MALAFSGTNSHFYEDHLKNKNTHSLYFVMGKLWRPVRLQNSKKITFLQIQARLHHLSSVNEQMLLM